MNKRALKEFAVYARNELRRQIGLRAQTFGITPEGSSQLLVGSDYVELNGEKYDKAQKGAIEKLLSELKTKGYEQLIEEVAYTWFNRFIALRYMEVHRYLPSRIRVLSSEVNGKVDPDLLTEYRYADLKVDEDEIALFLQEGKRDEAFRQLLVAQCNELNDIMPFLFEKISDFTELLLPDNLLHADSLINRLVNSVKEENFEHVEVIGWLYQYYISEKKDEVFAGLKKNKKITKENIPAATQLFTPQWIVRYMVDNSLGHMWIEAHKDSDLKESMKYYIEPAEQEPEVQEKLEELKNLNLSPEEITVIDPACGSGHILIYAFDLLYKIYEEQGYPIRDIPKLILENNLYGIDIDDRAAQLASFALMMKAREKTKRIFNEPPKLNIISIQEANSIDIEGVVNLLTEDFSEEKEQLRSFINTFKNAKNFGSILKPIDISYEFFIGKISELMRKGTKSLFDVGLIDDLPLVAQLLNQGRLLTKEYDIVITNPPYMAQKGMNKPLSELLKKNYSKSKNDLFAAFISRSGQLCKKNGFQALITQHSWMFLSSFFDLRKDFLANHTLISLNHLGTSAFEDISGEVVQTVAFVSRNLYLSSYKGTFIDLTKYKDRKLKQENFLKRNNVYISPIDTFNKIPSRQIAYWISEKFSQTFENPTLNKIAFSEGQILTGNNEKYLRMIWEVEGDNIGFGKKWALHTKGGEFRKWYGNVDMVVDWSPSARKHYKEDKIARIPPKYIWYKNGITWSGTASVSKYSARYLEQEVTFNKAAPSIFFEEESDLFCILGLLNTTISRKILYMMNPTMYTAISDVLNMPILKLELPVKRQIVNIVKQNITMSKENWNSFETSFNFKIHPFLLINQNEINIRKAFSNWEEYTKKQFDQMSQNEETLNCIFNELFDLQDEIEAEVSKEENSIRIANRERDTRSFLSFAVGLMVGRYSLDKEGVAYAGGEWNASNYHLFKPDGDGIIPLTDQTYFEDDIISRLQEILIVIYGSETLQENLYWLAESLKMKENETPTERLRRYFFDEFYKDHCRIYQKRPIYWLAESGKKKGFRALFYLHRYTPETLATMRFSYVQNLQEKLRQEEKRIETVLISPDLSATEKRKLDKQLTTIRGQQEELVDFDKVLAEYANQRIELNLDDGVVENYKKLGNVLANIK
jgi:type II restriction/modification system DNA methylase subunit YeeA